ncbi:zinc finger DNA binding domain [Kluyveromyces marxianus]|uniref:Zinc finger DNA binding domain n=2 Tax=Kluyveromyces marxianus TaxID=4911 RepID=W0T9F6_KLUMD|nr:zinc finger DNA binding domain-containing protein [Kluyveromyces marxianus DMKU3-1042]QGN14467.1 zinc finger DNA binding domain [Kluyveromyces marxianus]BAO38729.1 zinc finger DNA binding domain [Kluyveromyces marxianus DMKU3-1042]BAP70273.1 zinc finger DNA binding domain [Kluyveromyces marxianus]
MVVSTTLAPIKCNDSKRCKLPPLKDLFAPTSLNTDAQIDRLREELLRNKEELQVILMKVKVLMEEFDYGSMVLLQAELKGIKQFTDQIRVKMIKHDCLDVHNNEDIKMDQLVLPSWFQFKRDGPKYCVHCECLETIEWRNGPWGKSTLCNACGLWYRKLRGTFSPEQSCLIMEDKRINSDKNDRKESLKFDMDEEKMSAVKSSLIDRMNQFIREVEISKSTKVKLGIIPKNSNKSQKVTPLEMNKYDSISRIC